MDISYLYKRIMHYNPYHTQVFDDRGVSNLVFINYVSLDDLLLTADCNDIRVIDEHLRYAFECS